MDCENASDSGFIEANDDRGSNPLPRARPASPCVRICTLDDDKVCLGCGRSMAEIVAWPRMTVDEQYALLDELAKRRPAL